MKRTCAPLIPGKVCLMTVRLAPAAQLTLAAPLALVVLLTLAAPLALVVLLALAASTAPAANAQEVPSMTTVNEVDLQRYVGLWYEIARIPNRFQKDCAEGATAEYRLRDDGHLQVVNRCYREDGTLAEAEGVAKVADPDTNAKLKVSFVSFLGWRPFWGDYWILGLGEDYEWAVVGTPDRKYGWVLARTPQLDPQTLARAFDVIERNGYERDVFDMSLAE